MDKLETLFQMQQGFDKEIAETRGLTDILPEEWVQKEVLAMLSELAELLDEVNFKWWKNKKDVNWDNVKDELIDILHFFMSTCLKVGMSAEEVFDRYLKKNKENYDRQRGLSEKKGYELRKEGENG